MKPRLYDKSNDAILQISNDALYYFLYKESCLDSANMDEVKEIQDMFPLGFVLRNWEFIEDGLVEARFRPFVEYKENYDLYYDLSTNVQLHLTWLGPKKVRVRRYYLDSKIAEPYGDFDVWERKPGKASTWCFNKGDYASGHGCLFYIKNFKRHV